MASDVVGDEQGGKALCLPQAFDQRMHLDASQCVERAQRLIEQQQAGLVDQCAGEGDTLALSPGQP